MSITPTESSPVDFIEGALAHRRHYGGGRQQLIAKAVGLKPGITPTVLDATAGWGADAFVLATLGCEVTLLERNADVFHALSTALDRAQDHAAKHDPALASIVARMTWLHLDARDYLMQNTGNIPAVIYLDPMFPERKKSAAVKKKMVLLQHLVGEDPDADALFELAIHSEASRVVVKRPVLAPPLGSQAVPLVFRGASCRFDVYPRRSLALT